MTRALRGLGHAVLVWSMSGCVDSGDKPDDTGTTTDSADSASCTFEAAAQLWTDPPTFADVTWVAPGAQNVRVEYGNDTGYGRTATNVGDGVVTIPFLGTAADWHFRVTADIDGAPCTSADLQLRTDPPPATLPSLMATIPSPDPGDPTLIVTSIQGGGAAAVLIDHAGRYAWWHVEEAGISADRVRGDQAGTGVWVMERTYSDGVQGRLVHYPWAAPPDEVIPLLNAHHDFTEVHVDGTRLAWLVYEAREVDGKMIVGDAIHTLGDDGQEHELWNAFDHFPVEENVGWEQTTYPGMADWTHANSIEYLPDEDAFLISLHFVPVVVAVSRSTGETLWVFGEGAGFPQDFSFANGDPPDEMHSPTLTEQGMLMFENGSQDRGETFVAEFAIDWKARSATRLWRATPTEGTYAYVLGDAERLGNGNTLSTWGNLGMLVEFDADAEVVWKVNLGLGTIFGFFNQYTPPS